MCETQWSASSQVPKMPPVQTIFTVKLKTRKYLSPNFLSFVDESIFCFLAVVYFSLGQIENIFSVAAKQYD